jgi:hypothetical protein
MGAEVSYLFVGDVTRKRLSWSSLRTLNTLCTPLEDDSDQVLDSDVGRKFGIKIMNRLETKRSEFGSVRSMAFFYQRRVEMGVLGERKK